MPELPEVEVLARHLRPLILGQKVRTVRVLRARVVRPGTAAELKEALRGSRFHALERRGKFMLFNFRRVRESRSVMVVGHLGMTGRMYLQPKSKPLPRHAAVVLELDRQNFVYEDTRYFGRFTRDTSMLTALGPEPDSAAFSGAYLRSRLARSSQPIKVKLLDQSLVAGVGNIYASEALFRARVSPLLSARRLSAAQICRLRRAIRRVLAEAIRFGSTVPLNHGPAAREGLFYYGKATDVPDYYEERLRVYDREGKPCERCGASIRRIVQAARSTFYCPKCQR